MVVPAERADAKKRISSNGKSRSMRTLRITPPTCPVAPTIPTRMTSEVTDGRVVLQRDYQMCFNPARRQCGVQLLLYRRLLQLLRS